MDFDLLSITTFLKNLITILIAILSLAFLQMLFLRKIQAKANKKSKSIHLNKSKTLRGR